MPPRGGGGAAWSCCFVWLITNKKKNRHRFRDRIFVWWVLSIIGVLQTHIQKGSSMSP